MPLGRSYLETAAHVLERVPDVDGAVERVVVGASQAPYLAAAQPQQSSDERWRAPVRWHGSDHRAYLGRFEVRLLGPAVAQLGLRRQGDRIGGAWTGGDVAAGLGQPQRAAQHAVRVVDRLRGVILR